MQGWLSGRRTVLNEYGASTAGPTRLYLPSRGSASTLPLSSYAHMVHAEDAHLVDTCHLPSWQTRLRASSRHREENDSSIIIDHP